jgi:hypothetical protein
VCVAKTHAAAIVRRRAGDKLQVSPRGTDVASEP